MIIGIDPGVSGCIAILHDDYTYHSHLFMPTVKVGKNSRVNVAAIAGVLEPIKAGFVCRAVIELVNGMPPAKGGRKIGGASGFTFGHSAGMVEGAIACLGIPYRLTPPAAWKREAGLIGTDKDAARSRAIQLYPELRELDSKAKGQALADAILIARFGGRE